MVSLLYGSLVPCFLRGIFVPGPMFLVGGRGEGLVVRTETGESEKRAVCILLECFLV